MALRPEQFRNPLQTGVEEGGMLGLPWGPGPLPEVPRTKTEAEEPKAELPPVDTQPETVANGIPHNGHVQPEPSRLIMTTRIETVSQPDGRKRRVPVVEVFRAPVREVASSA